MYFLYGKTEVEYLKGKDKILGAVIDEIGHVDRETDTDLFSSVVHHIIGQQISTKAQATIWQRMKDSFGDVNAAAIAEADISELQSFGMTFRKAEYIQDFAKKVQDKEFDLQRIALMPDADAAANEEAMQEAIQNVKTGQVTYAVRDTHVDDKEIHEGDIMGIGDKGILAVGTEVEATAKEMLAQLVDEDSELISLYYGEEVSEEEAQKFTKEVEELYPDVDVDAHFGGQPIYYYVMAVE